MQQSPGNKLLPAKMFKETILSINTLHFSAKYGFPEVISSIIFMQMFSFFEEATNQRHIFNE